MDKRLFVFIVLGLFLVSSCAIPTTPDGVPAVSVPDANIVANEEPDSIIDYTEELKNSDLFYVVSVNEDKNEVIIQRIINLEEEIDEEQEDSNLYYNNLNDELVGERDLMKISEIINEFRNNILRYIPVKEDSDEEPTSEEIIYVDNVLDFKRGQIRKGEEISTSELKYYHPFLKCFYTSDSYSDMILVGNIENNLRQICPIYDKYNVKGEEFTNLINDIDYHKDIEKNAVHINEDITDFCKDYSKEMKFGLFDTENLKENKGKIFTCLQAKPFFEALDESENQNPGAGAISQP